MKLLFFNRVKFFCFLLQIAAINLIVTRAANAQAPDWQIATSGNNHQPTGTGYSFAHATAVDAAGDVIVVGSFTGQVTFGTTRLVSAGGYDAFVAKWSPASNAWVWASRDGGTGSDVCNGVTVSGNTVYVTGFFTSGTNAVIANTPLSGAGDMDAFVAKYTAAGVGVWASSGGGSGEDQGRDVAVSGTGVYVTGYFNGSSASLAGTTVPGAGDRDVFLAKYTDNGNSVANSWATSGGGTGEDQAYAVEVNGTNVYVAGFFASGANTTLAGTALTGNGDREIFVAKYTDAGSRSANGWAVSGGGTGSDQGVGLAVNGTSVYVTGYFGSRTAASIAGTPLTGTGTSAGDMFVAKYTDNGTTPTGRWAVSGGGTSQDVGASITTSGGAIYVSGFYQSPTATIAGSVLTNASNASVFVAKYTDAGNAALNGWASSSGKGSDMLNGAGVAVGNNKVYVAVDNLAPLGSSIGSFGSSPVLLAPTLSAVLGELNTSDGTWQRVAYPLQGGTSTTRAAVTDAAGNVYVTGYFNGSVGFGNTNLTSEGSGSMFLAKWGTAANAWLWAVGGGTTCAGSSVAVSGANVYVTGSFNSGAGTTTIAGVPLASNGNNDMFLAKYSDNGSSVSSGWALRGGGTGDDFGTGVAARGSDVYVTGIYLSNGAPASFGGTTLTGTGTRFADIFVAKYADQGASAAGRWAVSGGGSGDDSSNGIAVSGTNVYVTGYFTSGTNAVFSGTALPGAGSRDVFLAKYTDNGNSVANSWATSGGGTGEDQGHGVASNGPNVYVTGIFTSATPANFAGVSLAGAGSHDMFLAKYTDAGSSVANGWAVRGGGTEYDEGRGVAVTGNKVYVAGYFTGAATSATIAGISLPGTTPFNHNAFLARYTDNGSTATDGWALSGGGGGGLDNGRSVAVSGTNVYLAGQLTPVVSFGASTLSNPVGTGINYLAKTVDLLAEPTVTAFSPTSGTAGTAVTLTGTNLIGASLTVNGAVATITASTATSLTFTVPAGASSVQSIVVTTPGGSASSTAFTVLLQVTATTPAANAHAAPRTNSAVSLAFSEPVTAASTVPTATGGVKVFSAQVGGRKSGTVTASGNTISYTSSLGGARTNFMPGELVNVTVPGTVQGLGGLRASKKVVQFTAGAGSGPGTFGGGSDVTIPASSYGVTTGDVDGDGDLDVLAVNTNSGLGNQVSVRLNNGSGVFSAGAEVPVGTGPQSVKVADVDGDGDLDLLTANEVSNNVSVRLNDGSGNFTFGSDVAANTPLSLAVADVDGDGDLDVLTAGVLNTSSTVSVLLNNGNGTFVNGAAVPVGAYSISITTGDVDGDGDVDILTASNTTNSVSVRLNNGNGLFTYGADVPVGTSPYGVTAADLDGDGDLDFVTANFSASSLSVRLNNGSGTFSNGPTIPVATNPFNTAIGDIDGDGDLDIVSAHSSTTGVLNVRLNTGSGAFTSAANVAVGSNPFMAVLSDLDGDGDLDLASPSLSVTNASSTVSIRFNQNAAPTLTSLSPASGLPGDTITLAGTNLSNVTGVSFNGTAATLLANTAASITVTVPGGTSTGTVTVTTASGTSNGLLFTVLGDLVVSTVQTAQGSYRNVTVTGTGTATLSGPLLVRGAMVVQPGGALHTATHRISGRGAFALSRRATLSIADPDGISTSGSAGAVQVTGPRTFSPDAYYVYNSVADQRTGPGLPSRVARLSHLTANAVLTRTNPVAVREVLALHSRTPAALVGAAITLLSDADTTAAVDYSTGGNYAGAYVVQRHVKGDLYAGAGYRHFSAALDGATVNSLAVPGGFQPTVNANYNTATSPTTVTPFPTVLGYEEARLATTTNNLLAFDKGWVSPAALSTPLEAGRGYTVHMAANQTVQFAGTVRTGTVTVPLTRGASADAGWALVGNPFAAPFSLASLANVPGLDNAKYIYECTGPYTGNYRTYLPGSPAPGNPLAAIGQGFFTRVSTPNSSATLTMNSANTSPSGSAVFHRDTADTRALLTLVVSTPTNTLRDETSVYLQAGIPNGVDAVYDARKLLNPSGLNISQVEAGQLLAINGLPTLTGATVIPLAVAVPAAGTYTIGVAQLRNLPAGTIAVLVDASTGTRTNLAIQGNAVYTFTVTAAQVTTAGTGRFFLNLAPNAALASSAQALNAGLSLYPNPATASVKVFVPAVAGASQVRTTLFNVLGQVVSTQTTALPASGVQLTLGVSGLPRGVYIVRCSVGAVVATRRVVLE